MKYHSLHTDNSQSQQQLHKYHQQQHSLKQPQPLKTQSLHQPSTYLLPPLRHPTNYSNQFKHKLHFKTDQHLKVPHTKQQKFGRAVLDQNKNEKLHRKLLDILYLQNVKDVNPYIQTLHELLNNPGNYEQKQIKKVKELCYIGLGKNLITQRKISVPPYSRVNLLIRQFMIDVITEEIKELQRRYPERVYIQCNDRALGYTTNLLNQKMVKYISQKEIEQVIRQTNKIIQKQFISFKKKKQIEISSQVKASFWVSLLGIALLVIYVQFYHNRILMILAWVLIFCCIVLNVVSLIIRERGLHQNQNIIDQIRKKVIQFLQETNQKNSRCRWNCGKDFYWLQIIPLNQ